ncbi:MAG: Prochlorococcus phage [Bacteroidota bacterium]|jgi:hypothetical protein
MLATSLVFGSFLIVMFFIVGMMGGWIAREYMMNYREIPKLHPEFYDDNGNIIPDEVVAISFNPEYFDDEFDEDDD